MAVRGKRDGFWEMKFGGPYSGEEGTAEEGYKCTDCGTETIPEKGWNGEPDKSHCRDGCKYRGSDWKPGGVSNRFRRNFDRVFPNAPGAGL
jgi:hypothetical protein